MEDPSALLAHERARIAAGMRALAHLSWRYAIPLILGNGDEPSAPVNSASGFAVILNDRVYLATAAHVVQEYRARQATQPFTYMTAGKLGFDPFERIVYEDRQGDVALLSLHGLDSSQLDADVYVPIGGWPPLRPQVGDAVQFCGFPKAFRGATDRPEIDFGSLPGFGTVHTVGDTYCTTVIERAEVIKIGRGPDLPPASALGGLSGAPVLLCGSLAYPIVGLVSEVNETFDIVRIALLSQIPVCFDSHAV